jgi:hypothetical protein
VLNIDYGVNINKQKRVFWYQSSSQQWKRIIRRYFTMSNDESFPFYEVTPRNGKMKIYAFISECTDLNITFISSSNGRHHYPYSGIRLRKVKQIEIENNQYLNSIADSLLSESM